MDILEFKRSAIRWNEMVNGYKQQPSAQLAIMVAEERELKQATGTEAEAFELCDVIWTAVWLEKLAERHGLFAMPIDASRTWKEAVFRLRGIEGHEKYLRAVEQSNWSKIQIASGFMMPTSHLDPKRFCNIKIKGMKRNGVTYAWLVGEARWIYRQGRSPQ